MVSFRSAEKQAEFAARGLDLQSQGTERNYQQALTGLAEFLKENRLGDLRGLDSKNATAYLEMRAEMVSQKTLDLDRQAMQAVLGEKLPVVKTELATTLGSRAYTAAQAVLVAGAQNQKNSLATLIAENAGLRAHELLTLRPVGERPADTHREFLGDRFAGRENVKIYTVQGKGGLVREVAISSALADRLEATRRDAPATVYDRGIGYSQIYDIAGGQRWSNSFGAASNRELGWSNGAHGLRHEFAQSRMNTLQGTGYAYKEALEIVSQEMGHFRGEITEVYLR